MDNTRQSIKVTFDNGDEIKTEINGTIDEIIEYYIGKWFNIGKGGRDNVRRAMKVAFYDGEYYLTHKTQAKEYTVSDLSDPVFNTGDLIVNTSRDSTCGTLRTGDIVEVLDYVPAWYSATWCGNALVIGRRLSDAKIIEAYAYRFKKIES